MTDQPPTNPDILVALGEPPTEPADLRRWLIEHMTSWYWGRPVTANARDLAERALEAIEGCGIRPAELNRLRRIETALVQLGAPNWSEKGDPGGLVIEWARELVAENKLLRTERDDFALQVEQFQASDE